MLQATTRMLEEMAQAIAREANPEKVILFGSYAQGVTSGDSDVDLLIVQARPFGPDRSRRAEISRIRRALSPFRVPKDILVYSREEMARWADSVNHIIGRALRTGKVLYERS